MFSKLEETFDLEAVDVDVPLVKSREVVEVEPQGDMVALNAEDEKDKADRDLARETFKRMITKSEDMLEALTQIAAGTEHPRAFEVAANLVKTITDVASKLDEVSSRSMLPKGKGSRPETDGPQQNIQNNLFVGSSEELMRMIRNGGSSTVDA